MLTRRQAKKNMENMMSMVRGCTVSLPRIPPEKLENYMNNVALDDVAVHRPTKRNERVMSCAESRTVENGDEFQETGSNSIIQPLPIQPTNVRRSDAVASCAASTVNGHNEHVIEAALVQPTEGNVVLVDVPVRRLTKRNKRVMSCVQFTFEDRDEYQEKDSNPIIQPASNQSASVRRPLTQTTEKSMHLKPTVNILPTVPKLNRIDRNIATSSKSNENAPPKAASANNCSQCFIYKQNIVQLKKRIKLMQNEAVTLMAQHDQLQDRCAQVLQENLALQKDLFEYRKM